MNIFGSLYYVSQGETPDQHLSNISNACKAGIKLVQIRLKGLKKQVLFETIKNAKKICHMFNTVLIVNDYVGIAAELRVDGVHLGKRDMSIEKARVLLPGTLLGGTANTLEDCVRLVKEKVDYIGLGPFRLSSTKKNLSPVLGLDGYHGIINNLNRTFDHFPPIIAIGGIEKKDCKALLKAGVDGIATSSWLTNNPQISDDIKEFKTLKRLWLHH